MMKKIILIAIFILTSFSLIAQALPEYGNVNMDSEINIVDALMTAQYYVGLSPSPFNTEAADVDGDGTITIVDALFIAQFDVGLITGFPASELSGPEVLSSDLTRDPDPQVSDSELKELATGNSQFAIDCYNQISQGTGNLFFSPISLSYALAMTYTGAGGNTAAQMADTLGFTLPETTLHAAFNRLDYELSKENVPNSSFGENMILKIANSTWGQKGTYFEPLFLDTLAVNYGAAMYLLDFLLDPAGSEDIINNWVNVETGGRIPTLLPRGILGSDTNLVLTNAIYFKAKWLDIFDPKDTTTASFRRIDNSSVMIPMMHQSVQTGYGEGTDYQVIRLSYQGSNRTHMMIIMPGQGQFDSFEENLTLDKISRISNNRSEHIVTLSMPKFELECSNDFTPILKSLGMTDAFSNSDADFSGITGTRDLMIEKVIHKANITVDEEGTEASAATAVIMAQPSIPPAATMNLNRPFIFVIYHTSTDSILFMGRVMDPS